MKKICVICEICGTKNSDEKNPDEKNRKTLHFPNNNLNFAGEKAKKLQLWQKKVEIAIGRHLPKEEKSVEQFTHGYYQGLIIEIGNMKHFDTYIPAQDQNRKFLEKPLKDICSTTHIPDFSYNNLTDRARTVDVIWFNERQMPDSFFEVEHSTDIQNSVTKFCDLQDFHSRFLIVAPQNRKEQFDKVMSRTAFKDIKDRVAFHSYESISKQYELMRAARASEGFI